MLLVEGLQRPAVDDTDRTATDGTEASVAPERDQSIGEGHVTVCRHACKRVRQRRQRGQRHRIFGRCVELGIGGSELESKRDATGNQLANRPDQDVAPFLVDRTSCDDGLVVDPERNERDVPDGGRPGAQYLAPQRQHRSALHRVRMISDGRYQVDDLDARGLDGHGQAALDDRRGTSEVVADVGTGNHVCLSRRAGDDLAVALPSETDRPVAERLAAAQRPALVGVTLNRR